MRASSKATRPPRSCATRCGRMGHRGACGRSPAARRQRGLRDRHGRDGRRQRFPVARHVGRAVRRQRPLRAEPGCGRARVLPLRRRALAPDERDPVGRREPRLVRGAHGTTVRRCRARRTCRGRRVRRCSVSRWRTYAHNDAHARGVFFGLSNEHAADELAYAVMEGVVSRWPTTARRAARRRLDAVSFIGGGSKSGSGRGCARMRPPRCNATRTARSVRALGAARLAASRDR